MLTYLLNHLHLQHFLMQSRGNMMNDSYHEVPTATAKMAPVTKFSCPLTKTIMESPVFVSCCSTNFERKALLDYMQRNGNRYPLSGKRLNPSDLKPNTKLQWEISLLLRHSSDADRCNEESWTSSHSSTFLSPPKVDTPPIHPRSPETAATRLRQAGCLTIM